MKFFNFRQSAYLSPLLAAFLLWQDWRCGLVFAVISAAMLAAVWWGDRYR